MPEQFESVYRVLGFTHNGKRMALYDIHRDDVAFVNTVGYDEEIDSEVDQVRAGNVVEATVTYEDGNDYWNLSDFSIEHDSRLHFNSTDEFAPGPMDKFWGKGGGEMVSAVFRDDETDEMQYEVQLQKQIVVDEDGDEYDTFEGLRNGNLLTEPFYNGDGTEYIDAAEAVIVANPESREYIAFYIFPELNDFYEDIQDEFDERTIN